MTSKKRATYNPAARDGDGDGFVQDGTEFERPVQPEPETTPSEALEAPSEVTAAEPKAKTYTAKSGDSYAFIAELHPVAGMTKHERALQLWRDHGGGQLKDGTVITL